MFTAGWTSIACAAEPGSGALEESCNDLKIDHDGSEEGCLHRAESVLTSWRAIAAPIEQAGIAGDGVEVGSRIPSVLGDCVYPLSRKPRGRPKKVARTDDLQTHGVSSAGPSMCRPLDAQVSVVEACSLQDNVTCSVLEQLALHGVPRVSTLGSYDRKRLRGHSLNPVTSAAMVWCAEQSKKDAGDRDSDYMKLGSYYLEESESFHVASVASRSAELGISDKVLELKLCRLAAAQLCYGRLCRAFLEQRLCEHGHVTPVGYSEFLAYDETPLRAGVKPSLGSSLGAHVGQPEASGMLPAEALLFARCHAVSDRKPSLRRSCNAIR
eukprot:6492287-Amphidinium_carterae.4